jgi:hypothetical protein
VHHAPHAEAAEQLFEYLQRPVVTERLVAAKALEGRSPTAVTVPTLKFQWDVLLKDLEIVTAKLNEIFLR